ncbi:MULTISPECIES: transcriptional repressor LexA [unclassified Halanaerobium]|uniref:transcriptional repressor LexA n=1 Tax=unclassified Halanaerobium TaxID=2641197 RepID=UPI000DF3712B|nr:MULTISPECIES: transcriptional repressor LexA [unclassified Halanaerobium]RCW51487.1 repressor LexA [Halanaerobium sp. MA284_MarDTE_T2]RCW89275.1 repressor LexA [Halanaerobium sp. DL-01]
MNELSDRQKSILKFIMREIDEKGYPPSVREIGSAVGLKSPASVHSHLKTLEKLKYLRRDPSKPRAIEVIYENDNIEKDKKEMLKIPVVGKVTAGEPILAEENIEDYFPFPVDYLKVRNKEIFMLQVSGDSMHDAGIYDHDYVIAQKQNHAENRDIVIALLDDEATVKRFFKEDDYIRLQPENVAYEPIISKNVVVLGKVIGLYRNLSF